MDATIDLLTDAGYHRLTIESIAAQAGVGKATVYRWWPTKAQLVVEALGSRLEILPVESTGELKADVQALIHRAIETFTKSPLSHVLPEMATDLDGDPDARAQLVKIFGPARAGNLGLLYSAAGRAELPYDVDAGLLLDIIAGTVLYRRLLGRRLSSTMVEQLTDFIVDMHLPRSSPTSDSEA
jgi:AcrR family transcriptional regulator